MALGVRVAHTVMSRSDAIMINSFINYRCFPDPAGGMSVRPEYRIVMSLPHQD
jgi:hypothetical protein